MHPQNLSPSLFPRGNNVVSTLTIYLFTVLKLRISRTSGSSIVCLRVELFKYSLASKDTAWSIPVASYMVIIMGVQYYEGKDHRCVRSMLPTKPAPYSSFLAPSPTSTSETARIGSYNDKLPE